MKKTFCDACGKPASRVQEYFRVVVADHVLCDKKAKIVMSVHSKFKDHSTGFGGPPDLCDGCFIDFLHALRLEALKKAGVDVDNQKEQVCQPLTTEQIVEKVGDLHVSGALKHNTVRTIIEIVEENERLKRF